MVLYQVEQELTGSKVEKYKYGFTGVDISTVEDGIEVQMNDYMQSLKDIEEIRKTDRDEELSMLDMKEYLRHIQYMFVPKANIRP